MFRRRRLLILLVAAALAAVLAPSVLSSDRGAATAVAAPEDPLDVARLLLSQQVTTDATRDRSCIEMVATGQAGVVTRSAEAPPAGGLLTATLDAAGGDWDLAVFDERTGVPARPGRRVR
jgi:hypothetical protein